MHLASLVHTLLFQCILAHFCKLVHLRLLHFYSFFSCLFLAFEQLDPVLQHHNLILCMLSHLPLLEHLDTLLDKVWPILLIIDRQLWISLCTWRACSLLLIIVINVVVAAHVWSKDVLGLLAMHLLLRLQIVVFLLELFTDLWMACNSFFNLLGQGCCTVQPFADSCRHFERVSYRSLIWMGSLSRASWTAMKLNVRLLLGHLWVMVEVKSMIVSWMDVWNAIFRLWKHVMGLDPSSRIHLLLLLHMILLMPSLIWGLLRDNVKLSIKVICLLIDHYMTLIGVGLNEVAIDDIKLLFVTVRIDVILLSFLNIVTIVKLLGYLLVGWGCHLTHKSFVLRRYLRRVVRHLGLWDSAATLSFVLRIVITCCRLRDQDWWILERVKHNVASRWVYLLGSWV